MRLSAPLAAFAGILCSATALDAQNSAYSVTNPPARVAGSAASGATPLGDSATVAQITGIWRGSDAMDTHRNNFTLELRADGRYAVTAFRSLAIGAGDAPPIEAGRWRVTAPRDPDGFGAATLCVEPSQGQFLPARCFGLVVANTQMSWSGTGARADRQIFLFYRDGYR